MLSENLFHKLGIHPGDRICLIEPPPGIPKLLEEAAPHGVIFSPNPEGEPFDHILYWSPQVDELPNRLMQFAFIIDSNGAVWLIIPKKKFARARDISFTWEEMQAAALQSDFVDNKMASFSDTDYATRFAIRKEYRHRYA